MKTIDLLIKELPALGGWPDGAVAASFLCSKNTLSFANKNGGCPLAWRFNMNYEVEDRCTEVTREQYEAALAAKNEGWIEWGGGECPVNPSEMVDVIFGHGGRMSSNIADCWRWNHSGTDSDIIAYRLHQPQEAEQAKADDETDLNECIGQDAAQVWNGEGVMPTVGSVCERSWAGDEWQPCKILFISNQFVVVKLKESGMEDAYNIGDVTFRPMRSEAERKRDKAIEEMIKIATMYTTKSLGLDLAFNSIYNSIAAGEIPGVKLED